MLAATWYFDPGSKSISDLKTGGFIPENFSLKTINIPLILIYIDVGYIYLPMYIFLCIKNLKIKIYKTVILPVVLYGCETWSLTLREEHRLRVSKNGVLRRIFGPKREEDVSWRKLHNDELHSLYSSRNIIRVIKSRRMRWAGHVARMGEGRGVYRVLVGRPEGKRPLGRPKRRWENNIKMDLREIGIDGANWLHLAQDRVQWRAVVNTDEPSDSIKISGYFLKS
jgi:hypothetical protein